MSTDEQNDPQDLVRYHLHRLLCREEEARPIETLHASEVTQESPEFCGRAYALMDLTGKRPHPESVTTSVALVRAVGHWYQDQVTRWLVDAGLAVGDWICLRCAYEHAFQKHPDTCQSCTFPHLVYREVRFRSRLSGASCGVDVFVQLPGREKLTLVEVKSEQKEDYQKLKMPRAEHRARTSWYLRLIDESGDPAKRLIDTDEARLLYVCKNGWGQKDPGIRAWRVPDEGQWSPFKEFVVRRDDSVSEPYHQKAKPVKEFREGGPMPEGICPTQFCRRAKGCVVVHECFSGDYPPGEG